MLRVWKGATHAAFNGLTTDDGIAMWRHIGEQRTAQLAVTFTPSRIRAQTDNHGLHLTCGARR